MSRTSDRVSAAALAVGSAVVGGLATDPGSRWFSRLSKPAFYPPPQAFGIVWTALYAGIAWAGGEVLANADARRRHDFGQAYAINLALNTAWTPIFFRAHRPWLATLESAALTASTVDLVRRADRVSRAGGSSPGALRGLDGVRHRAVRGDRPPQLIRPRG